MNKQNKPMMIIWDFDGTIADTWQRNLNVTKSIVEDIFKTSADKYPGLSSLDEYRSNQAKVVNWREFYKESFGMNEEQVDKAGKLWTEYQLVSNTPIPLIAGIDKAIKELSQFSQAIVSQNSSKNIIRYLEAQGLAMFFQKVIGYEEVDIKRQKPFPDGLLACINHVSNSENGYVFYIGDHKTDAQLVVETNKVLTETGKSIRVLSIGACYDLQVDTSDWKYLPDFIVNKPEDIPSVIGNFKTRNI